MVPKLGQLSVLAALLETTGLIALDGSSSDLQPLCFVNFDYINGLLQSSMFTLH